MVRRITAPTGTEEQKSEKPASGHGRKHRVNWAFPLGLGLAGLASVATVLLRGCMHKNMGWPVRAEDEHGEFSYQVCNDCGIMRLFDEVKFRGFGSYGYDLHALIARARLSRRQRAHKAVAQADEAKRIPG